MSEIIDKFEGEYAFLDNSFECDIRLPEGIYSNAEAAFQAQKCSNPADRRPFQYDCDAYIAYRLGGTVTPPADWNEVRYQKMLEVLREKFLQNRDLRVKLLETKDAALIAGNTFHDNFWGHCTCPKCNDQKYFNWTGRILEQIREAYKNQKEDKQ